VSQRVMTNGGAANLPHSGSHRSCWLHYRGASEVVMLAAGRPKESAWRCQLTQLSQCHKIARTKEDAQVCPRDARGHTHGNIQLPSQQQPSALLTLYQFSQPTQRQGESTRVPGAPATTQPSLQGFSNHPPTQHPITIIQHHICRQVVLPRPYLRTHVVFCQNSPAGARQHDSGYDARLLRLGRGEDQDESAIRFIQPRNGPSLQEVHNAGPASAEQGRDDA
jgi:hypothetical protein